MKSEQTIQSEILLALNNKGHRVWRSNAGRIQDKRTNAWIKLFPKGFTDLVGHRKGDGKAIYIEVKNEKGKLRPEQKKFRDAMLKQPVIYGVARSANEAIAIVEEGKKIYG